MPLTSLLFIAFVLVCLVLYYVCPPRYQNAILLGGSYLFMASWSRQAAVVFAALTVITFLCAQRITPGTKHARLILWIGILANLGTLLFFRFNGFFFRNFSRLLQAIGLPDPIGVFNLLLPIGLSFLILQSISYLLDVSRGLISPSDNLINFGVYLAYFPKMIAGPIERARDFFKQLDESRVVDNEVVARSLALILVGTVRKTVIADILLAQLPMGVFRTPANFSGLDLLFSLLLYGLIIYNDFAGYSSIVRGISGLFGIELSRNFGEPYFSRNFTEFWQRWHITFSHWLRDYIFTPLTRALLKRNISRQHWVSLTVPPMVTMLISALWHGATLNMLVWGGMHGAYQSAERILKSRGSTRPVNTLPWWRQGISMLAVFGLTLLAWVPFRMNLPTALQYWQGLVSPANWRLPSQLRFSTPQWLMIVLLSLFALGLDVITARYGEFFALKLPPYAKPILINATLFLIIVAISIQTRLPAFIYQGF